MKPCAIYADVRHDLVRTQVTDLTRMTPAELEGGFAALLDEANRSLAFERTPESERRFLMSLDLRYQGQNYELNLPIGESLFREASLAPLVESFHAQHRQVYGYELSRRVVQLVNLRVTAVGAMPSAAWPGLEPAQAAAEPVVRRRMLIDGGIDRETTVYRFVDLRPGHSVPGPAMVEYPGSTLFVPSSWTARCDALGNMRLERTAALEPSTSGGGTR